MNFSKQIISTIPQTGDKGLSPILLVLLILCGVIIIGCIIWALFIGRKNGGSTKVITISDDSESNNQTVVEDITSDKKDESEN